MGTVLPDFPAISCYDMATQDIVHINDYTFKKRFLGTC